MRLLKKITDMEILNKEGISEAEPRFAARAVMVNDNNEIAVMYSPVFHLYSLPGGGIQDGENRREAVKREVLEETGYLCEIVQELGYVYENRAHCDFVQYSYYHVVKTAGLQGQTNLEEDERKSGMHVQWHSLEETIRLITDPVHDTVQKKFIQAKDRAALEEFLRVRKID